MQHYVLRPLKENYKTIIVSVTEIEKALVPFKYACTDEKKSANIFWAWHLVEQIVWATISKGREYWLEQVDIVRKYMDKENMKYNTSSWKPDKQFEFLYDWLEQIVEHVRPFEAQYDMRNFRMLCELDCSSYKVILTGEVDWWMNWAAIWDCKTSGSKWKEDEKWEQGCFQWRFYPFMMMLANPGCSEVAFYYWVFTKQKTIQFQRIEHIVTKEEALRFVKDKMYDYLEKLNNGELEWKSTALDRM